MNQDGEYSFSDGKLIIKDPRLCLNFVCEFSPKYLPEDLKEAPDIRLQFYGGNNPSLEAAWTLKNGKPCGQMKRFHLDGSLKQEAFYLFSEKGPCLLHGPSVFYSVSGQCVSRVWYIEGKKQGKQLCYYPNGVLCSRQSFVDGLLHGPQEFFYETSTQKSWMDYEKGVLHGKVFLYHANGKIHRSMTYCKGNREGAEEEKTPKGDLLSFKRYEKGVLKKEQHFNSDNVLIQENEYIGPMSRYNHKKWFPQGQKMSEGKFIDERYEYRDWDDQGVLTKEYIGFWDGERVVIEKFLKGKATLDEVSRLQRAT